MPDKKSLILGKTATMKYSHIVFSVFTLAALSPLNFAKGAGIVAPLGLETVEGSNRRYVNDIENDLSFRHQELFLASEFEGLPPSHNTIEAIRWRPDFTKTAGSTTFDRFQLRLSTTSATPGSGISSNLDDNVGADETLVHDGPLTLVATEAGSAPRPFEYLIEFQTPFTYDPSAGNLLVDRTLTLVAGTIAPIADSHDVGEIRSVFNGGSTPRQSLVTVTEFTVVPEPSAMLLYGVGTFVGLAAIRRRGKTMSTVSLLRHGVPEPESLVSSAIAALLVTFSIWRKPANRSSASTLIYRHFR